MRKAVPIALALTLIATLASAQYKRQPNQPAQGSTPLVVSGSQTNPALFPRISQEDAYKLYKSEKAVFIDVRSNAQFQLGHIEGALSIPGSQLVRRFAEVPHGKTVVTYCACSAEQSSGRAATELIQHGVKNVFALKGGINEWKKLGRPTKTGEK
jgi:rhodanese-related sulfurtransferase